MSISYRRLRRVFWVLPQIYYYTPHRFPGREMSILSARSDASSCNVKSNIHRRTLELLRHSGKRYSTVSEAKHELLPTVDILSFIRSSLHVSEGPYHCWLNTFPDGRNSFKEDGIFLVLMDGHLEHSSKSDQSSSKIFEKVKFLQQRYPFLQVLAVESRISICLKDISTHLLLRVMKEYANFPILLSNKNIFERASGLIISKGFQNPSYYPDDVDLKMLDKAIRDLDVDHSNAVMTSDMKSSWVKPTEIVKEPAVCSALQNMLFPFPGCISIEEGGDRLFLSDVNHHRIIVFNTNGKILDAIGSSPGFEDGEFESARLMRPAASFYCAFEDCLYFVDSENHAIRRADMERRVVETVFPAVDGSKKNGGLWKWILDKIWTTRNVKLKSEDFNSESFLFPWHLLKSSDNDLFVLNESFGILWIIDLESGVIKEIVKEPSKIFDICGPMILEKTGPLRHLPAEWFQPQIDASCSFEGIPYAGLMSSVAICQDHLVFCDAVGQRVVKFSKGSRSPTTFQFLNFGTLGLPYWLSIPLERVYAINDKVSEIDLDHLQHFRLLPGRVDIMLNIDIPQDTSLVELPQEGCIWRQARGSAAEVSGVENKAASTEKVGVAQQWYDEIDGLSFSTPQEELTEEESKLHNEELREGRVRIGCTINTSPGTSEVIIYAALYLRLQKNVSSPVDSREDKAATIADILDPKRRFRKDLLVKLLAMPNRELEELVFMRPVHVRLRFNSHNHPKADNSKDIILTDSSVKVDIKL